MIGSPAYELAAHVSSIISPVLGNTDYTSRYTVPNSKTFVEELKRVALNGTEEIVSLDFFLFTQAPVEDAVEVGNLLKTGG